MPTEIFEPANVDAFVPHGARPSGVVQSLPPASSRPRTEQQAVPARERGRTVNKRRKISNGPDCHENCKAICMGCQDEVDPTKGIECSSNHVFCDECSTRSFGVYISEYHGQPMRCWVCKEEYTRKYLEKKMTSHQKLIYRKKEEEIRTGQDLEGKPKCPKCGMHGAQSRLTIHGEAMVCVRRGCNVTFCRFCRKDICHIPDFAGHLEECEALGSIERRILDVVAQCSTRKCPGCGMKGLKNDLCTHMQCEECKTRWCYVCAKSSEECGGIDRHNINWYKDPKACPMYLEYVSEVDNSWPSNPRKCVEFFHRRLTLMELNQLRLDIGEERFDKTFQRFDSCRNSGFSVQEIATAPRQLFTRRVDMRSCPGCGGLRKLCYTCSDCRQCKATCCRCSETSKKKQGKSKAPQPQTHSPASLAANQNSVLPSHLVASRGNIPVSSALQRDPSAGSFDQPGPSQGPAARSDSVQRLLFDNPLEGKLLIDNLNLTITSPEPLYQHNTQDFRLEEWWTNL